MGNRLNAAIQWFAYTRIGGAIVLRYHRVADLESDPHRTTVASQHFREQMEVLRKRFRPIGLDELTRSFSTGGLPRRAVAVTFDDGYEDNLTEAKPILEDWDVPATVFVTTGYVESGREFWWDVLERILLSPGELPERLRMTAGGEKLDVVMGSAARYTTHAFEQNREWSWRSPGDPTPRHTLFRKLSERLRPLSESARDLVLDELLEWAGARPLVRAGYRPLTGDQLLRLAEGGLVQIGAHSVTHPLLSRVQPEQQSWEIHESKRYLEELLGRSVTSFAYPYGVSGHTVPIVRRAGFDLALGTSPGVILRGRRRYRLPRLYVGNWRGDEFERMLATLP